MRPFIVSILPVLLSATIINGCAVQTRTAEPSEFVYGLTLAPSGIDPHINSSAELGIPLRSVYDSLIFRDPVTLNFVPGLATSWQVSSDGLTYTFVLRQDVRFHDGTVFDADAVRVNLERILDPANKSQKAAPLLGPVKSIQVHDQSTISIVLSEPYAPLLDGLSQPYLGMASPRALAQYDAATYQFHQVGTGPYKFVEYSVNDRLVLQRNPDYTWGPSIVMNPGVPVVDRIVFRFYVEAASRSVALESDAVQIMGELLPADAKRLSDSGAIVVIPVEVPGQPLQFMFNTTRPPTDNIAVRQALIMALDRQTIVESTFQGYSRVAYGPITASTLYYDAAIEGRYAYDPVQAVALITSAGLKDTDGDGWRDSDGKPVVIDVVVPPWGQIPDVALLAQSQWQDTLHVHVNVRQVPSFPALSERAQSGSYNMIAFSNYGYDPAFIAGFFQSDGLRNWSHVNDLDLDRRLQAAQSTSDFELRAKLYSEIQNQIMDEALILPVRDNVNLNGVQPGIMNLHFDSQGWFPFLTDISFGP